MKVKTNLTPAELDHVGDHLSLLAKSLRNKALLLENPAEKELIRKADHVFDTMLESLQTEIARILLGKTSDD